MSDDQGFGWRPIEPGDAAEWAALLAAIVAVDHGWEYFSEEDLLEDFSDPCYDFARGSMAVYDATTMVGYGVLVSRSAADPVHDMRYKGGVHPAYRERGLGGGLLDWAEKAAIPLHQGRYPGQPLSLSGGCLSHNADTMALYGAHGYKPVRWFHAMVRDQAAALPEMPMLAGVRIVGLTRDRWEDARLIRNEAFHDHWDTTEITAEGWTRFMEHGAFRPALSFLADAGEEPAGFIIGHEYEGYAEATGIRDLFIPLVGTRRMARKRGIATALLARALTEAKCAGFTAASLSVDADSPTGALGLYERAGFTIEHTSIMQRKTLLE